MPLALIKKFNTLKYIVCIAKESRLEHPASQPPAATHFMAVLITHRLTSYEPSTPQRFHMTSRAVREMQIYYYSVFLVC